VCFDVVAHVAAFDPVVIVVAVVVVVSLLLLLLFTAFFPSKAHNFSDSSSSGSLSILPRSQCVCFDFQSEPRSFSDGNSVHRKSFTRKITISLLSPESSTYKRLSDALLVLLA
jgi:hypothetical protein